MMKKTILMTCGILCATLGGALTADAATGIVNLNKVLANDPAFTQASKAFNNEVVKLQADYDKKSKNMNNTQKQELMKSYQAQLDKKNAELVQPIQKKVDDAVAKIAKEKNLDTIVIPGGYVYGHIDVDITVDVQKAIR